MAGKRAREFFIYHNVSSGGTFTPLVASAISLLETITIQKDADFVIGKAAMRANSNSTGTVQTNAPVLCLWSNGPDGLQNQPWAIQAMYGDIGVAGTEPRNLYQPWTIERDTYFGISLTNLSASAIYLYLTHEGYKDYAGEAV